VTCKNASTILSRSCAVVEDLPLSPYGAPLAFLGSSTPEPTGGVAPGSSTSFSFVAAKVGTYRIACLVSGHEIDGMWDWLSVTRAGLPTLKT
jgi:Sulfocyanin (SoxE) domain